MPNHANNCRKCWIVVKAVAIFIGTTSSHFECASMTTRNILPSKGPAKSMCNLVQGLVGQDHGCMGAAGGGGRSCWHSRHCRTICSISWSMPGHHTRLRARAFIRETPGCPPCRSTRTNSRPGGGTTTRSPTNTQSLCTESSSLSSSSGFAGQPVRMCCSSRQTWIATSPLGNLCG